MTEKPYHEHAADIATELGRHRLRATPESALQASIESVLNTMGVDFGREVKLSPADRPDFMCGDVVLEAKAKYPKRSIYRQLERYAAHERVGAIILVTGTAMGMPAEINGKPVYVVSIGLGYL
jgi:hypothetical protein